MTAGLSIGSSAPLPAAGLSYPDRPVAAQHAPAARLTVSPNTDPLALAAARRALDEGWDLDAPEPSRQFFYLPFAHSETTQDQDLERPADGRTHEI